MAEIDKHDALKDQPFSYRRDKDGKLSVYHGTRLARVLRGRQAEKLLAVLETAESFAAQLAMAKATGNFKHGNER